MRSNEYIEITVGGEFWTIRQIGTSKISKAIKTYHDYEIIGPCMPYN